MSPHPSERDRTAPDLSTAGGVVILVFCLWVAAGAIGTLAYFDRVGAEWDAQNIPGQRAAEEIPSSVGAQTEER